MCGSKKKKAEKRVKEGRKRLADVIQELQTVTAFDRTILQSRLEEVRLVVGFPLDLTCDGPGALAIVISTD